MSSVIPQHPPLSPAQSPSTNQGDKNRNTRTDHRGRGQPPSTPASEGDRDASPKEQSPMWGRPPSSIKQRMPTPRDDLNPAASRDKAKAGSPGTTGGNPKADSTGATENKSKKQGLTEEDKAKAIEAAKEHIDSVQKKISEDPDYQVPVSEFVSIAKANFTDKDGNHIPEVVEMYDNFIINNQNNLKDVVSHLKELKQKILDDADRVQQTIMSIVAGSATF